MNTQLLSYSIICAKLLYLSKRSRKYLVRHLSNYELYRFASHLAFAV
jgi:hypothetical protein